MERKELFYAKRSCLASCIHTLISVQDMRRLLTTLFLMLSLTYCLGQNLQSINYTPENGLPSSQVYDIIQDDFGFLWFSTDKGLSRYNGYEFQNFDKQDGIADNVVFDFHKRPNGEIWCTTNSTKLFKISGRIPKFSNYRYNDSVSKYADNLVNNGVLFHKDGGISISYHSTSGCLTIMKDGTVLLPKPRGYDVSPKACVVRDHTNEPFFYYVDRGNEGHPPNVESHEFPFTSAKIPSHLEALIIGEVKFFGSNNELRWEYPDRIVTKRSKAKIIASGLLDKDRYWIGYRYGGVEVYHKDGEKLAHFLTDKSVTQLFEDHEGNSWVSTLEHGVFKFVSKEMFHLERTRGFKISSIEAGKSDGVFIGYDNGTVEQRTNKEEIKEIYRPKGVKSRVKMRYFDGELIFSSDRISRWSVSTGKLVHGKSNHRSNYLEAFKGNLLYGIGSVHIGKGLFDIEETNYIFRDMGINDVSVYKGHIYSGSKSGLYVSAYPNSKKIIQLMNGIRVDDLNLFNNWLVLGTNGNGIRIIDERHKEKYRITRKDGLLSNFVSSTYSENDSTLWVCTNKGASRVVFYQNGEYAIKSVTTGEGLLSNEVWDLIVQNDTVWIGTQKGVNYISIHDFNTQKSNQRSYYLQWSWIWVNGESMPEDGCLLHYQNEVKFNFLGLSFENPEGLIYRYKLEGYHKEWHYTRSRSITFSALAPGTYKLILEVKGNNQSWRKNEITYDFTIRKPFWRTWWFIGASILMLIGLIYGFFKVRILTYNKDIVRDIAIYTLRKIRRESPYVLIKQNGKEIRLYTNEIHFVKTDGNYLEIYTPSKKFMIRSSISQFIATLPDKVEFIQVHRSYIVRIEHVQQKSKKELTILEQAIPVGRKYQDQVDLIKMA